MSLLFIYFAQLFVVLLGTCIIYLSLFKLKLI